MKTTTKVLLSLSLTIFMLATPAAAQSDLPPQFAPSLLGWSMQGMELEEITAEWPLQLRGTVNAQGYLTSSGGVVYHVRKLHSDQAQFGDVPLGKLELFVWKPLQGLWSTVSLKIHGGELAETIEARWQIPANADLINSKIGWGEGVLGGQWAIKGLNLEFITKNDPRFALGGRLDLEGKVSGDLKNLVVQAQVEGQNVVWRSERIGTFQATWNHTNDRSALNIIWGPTTSPWGQASINIPLKLDLTTWDATWEDKKPHDLNISLNTLTSKRIRPFWRPPSAADFEVDLEVNGSGTLDTLQIVGTVEGKLRDQRRPDLPINGTLNVGPKDQTFRMALGDELAVLNIAIEAPLVKIRRQNKLWDDVVVLSTLDLNLPLPTAGPYMPDGIYDPQGRLNGQLKIQGTLANPEFTGEIASTDMAMTLVPLNQRFTSMDLRGRIKGDTFTIDAFNASSGKGGIEGSGQMKLEVTPPGQDKVDLWSDWRFTANMGFTFNAFPFIHPVFPNGLIEGQVDVDLKAKPNDTAIRVEVGKTEVELTDVRMPRAQTIPTNQGVRVVDLEGVRHLNPSIFEGEGHLNVDIAFLEPIHVEGSGADLLLDGRMIVDRNGDTATVEGGFEAVRGGKFELFDNTFVVRGGKLTLLGGDLSANRKDQNENSEQMPLYDPNKPTKARVLEPVIDFVARGQAVDTHILVQLRGPGRRPELIFVSSPALPAYQILTLLITGRVDAIDETNGEVRRQVTRLVSQFHNPGLSRQLYDKLGVDKLGLGFGASVAQPILTVGKQINRRLYIETIYHHGAPPDANEKEAHVEYRFSPVWTVDTNYGDAAIGSVGLFWQTRFGGENPSAPPEDWGDTKTETENPPPTTQELPAPETDEEPAAKGN